MVEVSVKSSSAFGSTSTTSSASTELLVGGIPHFLAISPMCWCRSCLPEAPKPSTANLMPLLLGEDSLETERSTKAGCKRPSSPTMAKQAMPARILPSFVEVEEDSEAEVESQHAPPAEGTLPMVPSVGIAWAKTL